MAEPSPPAPRELELLQALEAMTTELGYPPTVRELAARLGYKAPQSVQRLLDRLAQRGSIERPAGRRYRARRTVGVLPSKEVRRVPLQRDPWTRATQGSVPLPHPEIAAPTERVVAVWLARGLPGGPGRGDLLYCVANRRPARGDLVVTRDPDGRTRVLRYAEKPGQLAGTEGNRVAVVAAWLRLTR